MKVVSSVVLLAAILFGLVLWPSTGLPAPNASVVSAASSDPVIAAAGDIACDPRDADFNSGNGTSGACRQKYVADLMQTSTLAAVLTLGDTQYFCGGYQAFLQSYDLSWGRLKAITYPAVGNHEYLTTGGTDCTGANAGAAGYFKYFGAAAGKGYYSFDIGAWHLIALDSNCVDVGGCIATSPQGRWLLSDLASHPSACTLAFWHIPLFSSGGRAAQNTLWFWQVLYQHKADLILTGHDHIYERFAPQTPGGAPDPARGIREFIVGTGGADHTTVTSIAANSEVRNADTYGVLDLTLHSTGYDWKFVPEAGKSFTDSGSGACHNAAAQPSATPGSGATPETTPTATEQATSPAQATPTSTAPGTPAPTLPAQAGTIFSDGFESGNLSQWSSVQGLTVQATPAASGEYAARATGSGAGPAYARKQLPAAQADLYYAVQFDVLGQQSNTVNLVKLRTESNGPILSVSISSSGQLGYHNDVTGASIAGSVKAARGTWHSLQVHLKITTNGSLVEVWLDRGLVDSLSRADNFNDEPVGWIQLGENTGGMSYDIAFDNVAVAAHLINAPQGMCGIKK